jgi:SLOG family YspA-like protein
MHTTLAAQLAALELGHLSIVPIDRAPCTDPVDADAAEELGWAFVNLFHRAALKRSGQIDRATDEIRCLIASGDGSEVHASQLESEIARAQAAEAAMLALESLRETAARLYLDETGHSWRPAGGSRANHAAALTSAVIDGREFLRARAESRRRAVMPAGTPVVFAGGRLSFATDQQAKTFAGNVWNTLDKVREHVADMVLVHGGDTKGVDRLAASWAERRKVPQLTFSLDRRLGQRAGFRRNQQMLSLNPRYVVAFAGNGVLERLVIQAKDKGISVVDRRGPLGTHPKRAAREAAAA